MEKVHIYVYIFYLYWFMRYNEFSVFILYYLIIRGARILDISSLDGVENSTRDCVVIPKVCNVCVLPIFRIVSYSQMWNIIPNLKVENPIVKLKKSRPDPSLGYQQLWVPVHPY